MYVPDKHDSDVTVISQRTNAGLTSCAVCGNGYASGSETCDDGNTTDGDGCSSTCAAESTYTCTGSPSVCTNDCAAGVAPGAASSYHYQSVCYAYYTATTRTFSDAENSCIALGGHLATVSSAGVQSVLELMGSYAWVGMTDDGNEGNYRWLDGTAFSYTNWAGGQPNGGASENCGYLENAYLWHDYPCAEAHQYFCQIRDGDGPPAQAGGGGLATWLIQLRQANNLNYLGHMLTSSTQSSAATSPSPSPSHPAPSAASDVMPSLSSGGGGSTLSSSRSSSPALKQSVTAESSLRVRTCARAMKWFGGNATALGRLNLRLMKWLGFTCHA